MKSHFIPNRRQVVLSALAGSVACNSGSVPSSLELGGSARIGEQLPDLEAWIAETCTANNIPACRSALVQGDEIIWAYAYGVDDVRTKEPASLEKLFMLGSVTKTFTATMCMRLAEMGKIDLDNDLSEYVGFRVRNPYFPEQPITIRHVLTHSSSMLDGDQLTYSQSYTRRKSPKPPVEMMKAFYDADGPGGSRFWGKYAPSESTRYCNSAFGLISIAISAVMGKPDAQVYREVVLDPLGIRGAIDPTTFPREDYVTPHLFFEEGKPRFSYLDWENSETTAFAGLIDDDRVTQEDFKGFSGHSQFFPDYTFGTYADGGMIMSVLGLAKYASVFAQGGTSRGQQFLDPVSIEAMTSVASFHHYWRRTQAVGFNQIKPYAINKFAWGHNGTELGSKTTLRFDQEKKLALVSHCNLGQPFLATNETDDEFFRRAIFALERKPYVA
ncbi:MAG: serine hydrolase domain-containing protein [Pseudomonadota bacterium]